MATEKQNNKQMKIILAVLFILSAGLAIGQNNTLLVEAENFTNKGGWVVDPQFMDQMGSPFLMAHGLGKPVEDASTLVNFPAAGSYNIFVRTRNWAGYWSYKDIPGNLIS